MSENHCANAKHFLTLHRSGVLATHSVSNPGYPFGSITPYLLEVDSSFIIYISLIAEHYKNLKVNSRASITVVDPFGFEDPQAHARATVLLDFAQVSEAARPAVQQRFQSQFPDAVNHEIAHNFVLMRGEVHRIRWIQGFGSMGWISGEAFRAESVDEVVRHGSEIIAHMNDDHRDALVELVSAKTGKKPKPEHVMMTDINSTDFEISVRSVSGSIRCAFPEPVSTPDDARAGIIALLKNIRVTG